RGQRLAVDRRRQRGHGRHRQRRGRLGRVGRRLDHVVDGGGGESAEGSGGGKDKQGGRWTHGRRFGQVKGRGTTIAGAARRARSRAPAAPHCIKIRPLEVWSGAARSS